MTVRRPLAVIGGDLQEIPVGDSIATDLVPAGSTQLWSGGNASTVFTNSTPKLACGGAS